MKNPAHTLNVNAQAASPIHHTPDIRAVRKIKYHIGDTSLPKTSRLSGYNFSIYPLHFRRESPRSSRPSVKSIPTFTHQDHHSRPLQKSTNTSHNRLLTASARDGQAASAIGAAIE
ncbi:hypothetical protein G7K_2677-t1 [Saitoella complicata NRRL Y-17804]|uniref:Uncharacterized protein n=1 Tax=Saitoella complicata (strain BCRC 22490 / CBS 7301 / JCM 7358 / NBRC 10748 / NRRL Y-17804) TaxID=698492 RepID=A0A0E9NF88_SAICN|nr:hypothetical protein G7K_2677-t1 [Saitoella complicata NRRL Y-17804]